MVDRDLLLDISGFVPEKKWIYTALDVKIDTNFDQYRIDVNYRGLSQPWIYNQFIVDQIFLDVFRRVRESIKLVLKNPEYREGTLKMLTGMVEILAKK